MVRRFKHFKQHDEFPDDAPDDEKQNGDKEQSNGHSVSDNNDARKMKHCRRILCDRSKDKKSRNACQVMYTGLMSVLHGPFHCTLQRLCRIDKNIYDFRYYMYICLV